MRHRLVPPRAAVAVVLVVTALSMVVAGTASAAKPRRNSVFSGDGMTARVRANPASASWTIKVRAPCEGEGAPASKVLRMYSGDFDGDLSLRVHNLRITSTGMFTGSADVAQFDPEQDLEWQWKTSITGRFTSPARATGRYTMTYRKSGEVDDYTGKTTTYDYHCAVSDKPFILRRR